MRKIKIIATVVCLCFAFVLSACTNTLDSIDICNKYISAVVEVQVKDIDNSIVGYATGTIVSSDGYIVTNRHVIRSYNYTEQNYVYYSDIYIRRYNEDEFTKVEVVACSPDYDLALLKLDSQKPNDYFEMCEQPVSYGEKVHTIGNGNGFGLAYAQGYIAAPLRTVKYDGEFIDAIQASLMINEGNSGGPLINDKGQLVGITTFRLRDNQNNVIYGTCFCLPIATVKLFLQNFDVA